MRKNEKVRPRDIPRSNLGVLERKGKLVEFIAYCLNPNHYHFILKQKEEKGIEKFMQKIGTGYTMYFNKKHKRSGSLFQGKFKSIALYLKEKKELDKFILE